VPHQPAYVAHANALKDDLTVQEALSFLADLSMHVLPLPTAHAVHAALSRVSMLGSKDAQVRTLSQGQRRRVALARLLLQTGAGIWLLDEPYDALDQASTFALNEVLNEHISRDGSIVLTSHQPLTADAPRADQFWLRGPGERSGWNTDAFDDMADKIHPPTTRVLQ
jgi:heme exporter protein A